MRRRRDRVRCWCGHFARFEAYYGRWWCDRCDREVSVAVSAKWDAEAARADEEARGEARWKVYGFIGHTRKHIRVQFPETPTHIRQTREIVAAKSMAEVGRIVGESPRNLTNLSESGNPAEIEIATSAPGVLFWRPLDDRSGKWAQA